MQSTFLERKDTVGEIPPIRISATRRPKRILISVPHKNEAPAIRRLAKDLANRLQEEDIAVELSFGEGVGEKATNFRRSLNDNVPSEMLGVANTLFTLKDLAVRLHLIKGFLARGNSEALALELHTHGYISDDERVPYYSFAGKIPTTRMLMFYGALDMLLLMHKNAYSAFENSLMFKAMVKRISINMGIDLLMLNGLIKKDKAFLKSHAPNIAVIMVPALREQCNSIIPMGNNEGIQKAPYELTEFEKVYQTVSWKPMPHSARDIGALFHSLMRY